jgi:hypothetical protein
MSNIEVRKVLHEELGNIAGDRPHGSPSRR